jgi:hypothetical protein
VLMHTAFLYLMVDSITQVLGCCRANTSGKMGQTFSRGMGCSMCVNCSKGFQGICASTSGKLIHSRSGSKATWVCGVLVHEVQEVKDAGA